MTPLIWGRKYEIESLCYPPLQLAYLLYLNTGETKQFTPEFTEAVKAVLHVWELEVDHHASSYRFVREDAWRVEEDSLSNEDFGPDFWVTGMTWSGFRPLDDATTTYP